MFTRATKLLTLVLVVVTALAFGTRSSRAGDAGRAPAGHETASAAVERAPVPIELVELGAPGAPRTTCDDDACDAQCIAMGNCEGHCVTPTHCGCLRHLPGGLCP